MIKEFVKFGNEIISVQDILGFSLKQDEKKIPYLEVHLANQAKLVITAPQVMSLLPKIAAFINLAGEDVDAIRSAFIPKPVSAPKKIEEPKKVTEPKKEGRYNA